VYEALSYLLAVGEEALEGAFDVHQHFAEERAALRR
jgi:hypothetical protein